MKQKSIFIFLTLTLLLVACSGTSPVDQGSATQPSASNPVVYPAPGAAAQPASSGAYPAPGMPGAPASGASLASGYEPQASDTGLKRAQVFLEMADSQLIIAESMPVQVSVVLSGNLPDPCHLLRVVVKPADAQNKINLEVYSLAQTGSACITVLQPFLARIPLGSFPTGHYEVYINGELLGSFDS